MEIICVKYRTLHAWGRSNWYYILLELQDYETAKNRMKEFVGTIDERYNYSDKYGGCEIRRVGKAPKEIVIRRLKTAIYTAKDEVDLAISLTKLLEGV